MTISVFWDIFLICNFEDIVVCLVMPDKPNGFFTDKHKFSFLKQFVNILEIKDFQKSCNLSAIASSAITQDFEIFQTWNLRWNNHYHNNSPSTLFLNKL